MALPQEGGCASDDRVSSRAAEIARRGMMKSIRFAMLASAMLTACGMRTPSISVTAPPGALPRAGNVASNVPRHPMEKIILTEEDITDRPYQTLGDIKVTLRKWTVFDADPTREMMNQALMQKAAEMGADAVVLVRYGTVGIGASSWGTLEGRGRAVQFK